MLCNIYSSLFHRKGSNYSKKRKITDRHQDINTLQHTQANNSQTHRQEDKPYIGRTISLVLSLLLSYRSSWWEAANLTEIRSSNCWDLPYFAAQPIRGYLRVKSEPMMCSFVPDFTVIGSSCCPWLAKTPNFTVFRNSTFYDGAT